MRNTGAQATVASNTRVANLPDNLSNPQKKLARAIVRGDVREVVEFIHAQKEERVPQGYFDKAFDTANRKLMAFAVYHHLKNPGDGDRVLILHALAKSIPAEKHGLRTAILGLTSHGIAHVAASHAGTVNNFNRVRHRNTANVSKGLLFPGFNTYAKTANKRGKRARNYAVPAVRNHLNRTYHANTRTQPVNNVPVEELVARLENHRV